MADDRSVADFVRQNRGMLAIAGGALLGIYGLRKRSVGGVLVAAAGAALVVRELTLRAGDQQPNDEVGQAVWRGPIRVRKAITIQRPREQVFVFWRQLENLPKFMRHLEEVKSLDDRVSRWTARAPLGTVSWDAEITAETPNSMIAWRSLPGATVENHGSVLFTDAPGGRGTEVMVELEYTPPGGKLASIVARLFGEEPQSQIHEDLLRLRALLETGEVPTTDGQPSHQVRRAKSLIGTRLGGASAEDLPEASVR